MEHKSRDYEDYPLSRSQDNAAIQFRSEGCVTPPTSPPGSPVSSAQLHAKGTFDQEEQNTIFTYEPGKIQFNNDSPDAIVSSPQANSPDGTASVSEMQGENFDENYGWGMDYRMDERVLTRILEVVLTKMTEILENGENYDQDSEEEYRSPSVTGMHPENSDGNSDHYYDDGYGSPPTSVVQRMKSDENSHDYSDKSYATPSVSSMQRRDSGYESDDYYGSVWMMQQENSIEDSEEPVDFYREEANTAEYDSVVDTMEGKILIQHKNLELTDLKYRLLSGDEDWGISIIV